MAVPWGWADTPEEHGTGTGALPSPNNHPHPELTADNFNRQCVY
jgi:hypothetical protein